MGSRGRSIRLRIYFLVAIPLITMLGLFGYVATTSVTNWLNLDRAPTLIKETSEPLTDFVNLIQAERRAAVVYLSKPTAENLSTFQHAITVTKKGAGVVEAKLTSPATKESSTPEETKAINNVLHEVANMDGLRAQVSGKKLAPLQALEAYTNIIAGQGAVLQAEANSIQDSAPVIQGLGLISAVNTQEDVAEQDAVLSSALVTGKLTPEDRFAFSQAVGRLQADTLNYQQLLTPAELATYKATMKQLVPADIQSNLTRIQQAVPAGTPLSELTAQGLTPASWQLLTDTFLKGASQAGNAAAAKVLDANSQPAIDAKKRVVILAAVGAAGLILTLIVTLLLGRSINRRLGALRRSALTLATEQLPSVVARLRRGESVDVGAEAPPLRAGKDEIGQVGQAIDTVRQTAIRSAIDEARVRQGVNDMFRNLARRNQSLLQRQLTVLDEAERRTTDPDVLEDLFKMDHLTTRMRRHAEGLIILSGAPPGRSWSAPVKLIDVMRGAVAEVEDYARVTVSTQARTALSGSAVTDVIHLLAELVENATTLSPPFTQVRVNGETVANGFAIEIEDRGLGMNPQRLAELNERLANPPDINPANTEQLGLFVVGQLARRHGIRVMLRPSPYGGTSAVTLIPLALIVEDVPAAITSGAQPTLNGNGYNGAAADGHANGANGARAGGAWPGPAQAAGRGSTPPSGYLGSAGSRDRAAGGYPEQGGPAPGQSSIRIGGYSTGGYTAGGRGTGPAQPGTPGSSGAWRGRHGNDDVPVVTGVPVARDTAAQPAPEFDVFAPLNKGEHGGAPSAHQQPYPDFGGQPDPAYVSPYADPSSPSYQGDGVAYGATGPTGPAGPSGSNGQYGNAANMGVNGDSEAGYPDGGPANSGAEDPNGLPRRVRQASLAPQLRASTASSPQEPTGVPRASAASLNDMRNTLSAMQRGWQQGRSQAQRDTEGNGDGQ